MERQITKKQFAKNSLWRIIEQFSAKGISVIVSVVLARLLVPSDYGLIALTTIFTNLSDILIDGGFSTALIRKERIDDYDCSSVFLVNIIFATLLYIILFFSAPYISDYYNEPQLTVVLRVIGLNFFLKAFISVRSGIVSRNMQFKLLFICNIISSIISGIIGITLAYMGFGVWALVFLFLSQQLIFSIIFCFKVRWKMSLKLNIHSIREMLKFSLGVLGASLLNFIGGSIYSIVIGKKYSIEDLGYYNKGESLPMQLSLYTFGAMSSVLLPTISNCQNDFIRVKHIVRKVVVMTSFILMPFMIGLAITSKEVVLLLFTDKWSNAISIMPSMCLYYLSTPYLLINVQVFFALGHSMLRVKVEIFRLILMIVGIVVFGFIFKCSISQLAMLSGFISVVVSLESYLEVRKILHYSTSEVLSDIIKPLICSVAMAVLVLLFSSLINTFNIFVVFAFKVVLGILIYSVSSVLCRSEGLAEMLSIIEGRIKTK